MAEDILEVLEAQWEEPTTSLTTTREKILLWRENWSPSDVRTIEEEIDRLGATTFRIVNKSYVSCRTPAGRVAFRIFPGYIEYGSGFLPQDLSESQNWRLLSTFQNRSEAGTVALENHDTCPDCWTKLPLSGVCDCTD